jgi:hypothetical protein
VVGKTTINAAANLPAPDPVMVELDDANGGALPGRLVVFTVTGAASVSDDSVYTDAAGIATTGVTAGPAGTYTVTASSEGVASVTVTVTASNPVSDLIAVFSGDDQAGLAGEPLLPFTAIVLKEDGTPAGAGVPVTFAVASGGGSLSTTSTTTDANGRASTTLTLGTSGSQVVTASSPGLLGTTFTAVIADPCSAARQTTVPGTISRSLDTSDCHNSANRYVEYHNFVIGATAQYRFAEYSTAYTPSFSIRHPGGTDTVAFHTAATIADSATFKIFLTPASYWAAPSSSAANATGAFTVNSTNITGTDVTGCERVYITVGVTLNQNLSLTDCSFSRDATQKSDRFRIYLRNGQQIRVRLQAVPLAASSTDLWIAILNINTGAFTDIDCCGGATIEEGVFTAPNAGQYWIEAGVFASSAPPLGPYILEVLNP